MMPKNAKRLKKLLLVAGLSLAMVMALEAGQEMVEALEMKGLSIAFEPAAQSTSLDSAQDLATANPGLKALITTPPTQAPTIPTQPATESRANRSPSERPTPAPTAAHSTAHPTGSATTGSKRQTLALNTGAIDDPQQPISTVAPQMAAGQWYGASFPVEDFQEYTSPFGYRLSPYGGYTQEFHYGLDMAAPEGSYIRNWWSGMVVEVSDDSNCGTSVVVESGEWTHIYCHMQGHVESANGSRYMIDRDGGVQIAEGQPLPAGVRIGRVGMTGRTTGPHLHWGLKYQGNWVDPALVIRAMYDSQQGTQVSSGAGQ